MRSGLERCGDRFGRSEGGNAVTVSRPGSRTKRVGGALRRSSA